MKKQINNFWKKEHEEIPPPALTLSSSHSSHVHSRLSSLQHLQAAPEKENLPLFKAFKVSTVKKEISFRKGLLAWMKCVQHLRNWCVTPRETWLSLCSRSLPTAGSSSPLSKLNTETPTLPTPFHSCSLDLFLPRCVSLKAPPRILAPRLNLLPSLHMRMTLHLKQQQNWNLYRWKDLGDASIRVELGCPQKSF